MKKIATLFMGVVFGASAVQAQIYSFPFSEDFENGNVPPTDWRVTDEDGDGQTWDLADGSTSTVNGSFGAFSASWNGSALTPDNYLISPAIDLSNGVTATNIELSYYVYAQDQNWPAEHYKVVISNTGDSLAAFNAGTILIDETITTSTGMIPKSVDVSAFIGDTVHLAFVHYNVTDQFRLNLDDIAIREKPQNDLILTDAGFDAFYAITPLSQLPNGLSFYAEGENNGVNDALNAKVTVDVNLGTFMDTSNVVSTITSGATQTFTFANSFNPSSTGGYGVEFNLSSDSLDNLPGNNMLIDSVQISDTIYTCSTGGESALGAALAGETDNEFGVIYEMFAQDTASSMSFDVFQPSIDANYYAAIYSVTAGVPDDIPLYISDTINMDDNVDQNDLVTITVPFDKNYAVLLAGQYAISVVEMDGAETIGILINSSTPYVTGTSFTRSSVNQNAWTANDGFWTGSFNWAVSLNLGRSGYVPPIDPNAGINNNLSKEITLFPNPAKNVVIIDGVENAKSIEISDLTGKVVKNVNTNNNSSITVNTSDLVSGVYFVTVSNATSREVKKLVIK